MPSARDAVRGSAKRDDSKAKGFQSTIDALAEFFSAADGLEELSAAWHGQPIPPDALRHASLPDAKRQSVLTPAMPLKLLKKGLDSSRPLAASPGRGLPLWLGVGSKLTLVIVLPLTT